MWPLDIVNDEARRLCRYAAIMDSLGTGDSVRGHFFNATSTQCAVHTTSTHYRLYYPLVNPHLQHVCVELCV